MGKVLSNKKGISIGAYTFPDRKKPCLCIEEGNKCFLYGYFKSEALADEFMVRLAQLVGAIREDEEDG